MAIITLEQLLEGIEGDKTKIAAHINAKAGELKAKIFIDDGKDNVYVPKSRLDDEIAKKKELQTQIDTMTAEIGTLKKDLADKPELQAKITKLETDKADADKKMSDLNLSTAIKLAAMGSNPKDKSGADVVAFINREKLKLNSDGTVTGLDDEIKALKKSKPYLFDEASGGTGDPGDPQNPPPKKDQPGPSIGESLAKERFINQPQPGAANPRDAFFGTK